MSDELHLTTRKAEVFPACGKGLSSSHSVRIKVNRLDQTGSVLILALVYILSVGLIVGAIATWAMNDLNNTTKFRAARSLQYAASGAMEVAIHSIRYNPQLGTIAGGNSPLQTCWGSPWVPPSQSVVTTNNVVVAVWCQTYEDLTNGALLNSGGTTRVVTLSACLSSVLATNCASSPLLQAVVAFDDYQGGFKLNQTCTPPPTGTCGAFQKLESWTWGGAATTTTTTTIAG
jgi:hypothetical protein